MSRFVQQGDMSAEQIIQCSYDALAIVQLCERIVRESDGDLDVQVSGNLAICLGLAGELMAVVNDVVEAHEGLTGAAHERAA